MGKAKNSMMSMINEKNLLATRASPIRMRRVLDFSDVVCHATKETLEEVSSACAVFVRSERVSSTSSTFARLVQRRL